MTQRTLIRDLQENQFVEGVFAIQNGQLGKTKNGKAYLKCLLADRTGRTPGRMWNASDDLFQTVPSNGFVWVQGHTQPYDGQMQIIVQHLRPAQPTHSDLLDLLPSSTHDPQQMFDELQQILGSIQHEAIRALVGQYLEDEPLMEQFKQAPAATVLHHAYLSGLLEHTLSLLRLGDACCGLYPKLNRDIVLTGLFVHDLGKCAEMTWQQGFARTDEGQLVGHIARGVVWLRRKAEDCAALGNPVPEPIVMVLEHIILSHHGQPEYGAMMYPATPEAIAVSLLDNLDAKLNLALSAARPDDQPPAGDSGHFTERIFALDTRLYRPDPTTVVD